jgi:hypothetical protein
MLIVLGVFANAQDKKYAVYGIAFYNVENLFDTVDSEDTNDEDFTPNGGYHWNEMKYENKLKNMSAVLNQLGNKYCPQGPAIIGLSEVENRKVLDDLVAQGEFAKKDYQIVHEESPDYRGIDVALIYNPALFKLDSYKTFPFELPEETKYKTRDQLLVTGYISGEKVHVIVNHWPSRRAKSIRREQAAAVTRGIVDSLLNDDAAAKVFVMGDLNDDPTNNSVKKVLKGKRNKSDVKSDEMYNPYWDYYAQGIGTLGYKGSWNLFDQILMTKGLIGEDKQQLFYWKAEIFNKDFLISQEGRFKGYPKRTHSRGIYLNGYSDHLPVITYVAKQL